MDMEMDIWFISHIIVDVIDYLGWYFMFRMLFIEFLYPLLLFESLHLVIG